MRTAMNGTPAHDRGVMVVHDTPGRLRLRLPSGARTAALADALAAVPGVVHCAWTPRTRSLLLLYRPDAATAEGLVAAVAEQACVDAEPRARRPHPGPPACGDFAASVAGLMAEIDQRVTRTTRGLLGLRSVVPLALVLWAGRELARGRTAPLAWSSALWYAHGLFRDYNPGALER
jgi:hypothetical protein